MDSSAAEEKVSEEIAAWNTTYECHLRESDKSSKDERKFIATLSKPAHTAPIAGAVAHVHFSVRAGGALDYRIENMRYVHAGGSAFREAWVDRVLAHKAGLRDSVCADLARQDFAEHFHTFRVWAQTLTDAQLRRLDLSAFVIRE